MTAAHRRELMIIILRLGGICKESRWNVRVSLFPTTNFPFPRSPFQRARHADISFYETTIRATVSSIEKESITERPKGRISEKKGDKRERRYERKGWKAPTALWDAPLLWLPFSRLHLVTTPFPYPAPVSVKSPCYVSYCAVNAPTELLLFTIGAYMFLGRRRVLLLRREPDIL